MDFMNTLLGLFGLVIFVMCAIGGVMMMEAMVGTLVLLGLHIAMFPCNRCGHKSVVILFYDFYLMYLVMFICSCSVSIQRAPKLWPTTRICEGTY